MRSLCAECPLKRAAECSSHHRHCSTRRQHFYLECFRRAPLENRKIAVLKRMRMLRFQVSDRVACVSSPQAVEARRFLFTTPTSRTRRHGTTAEAGLTSVANVDQVGGGAVWTFWVFSSGQSLNYHPGDGRHSECLQPSCAPFSHCVSERCLSLLQTCAFWASHQSPAYVS